MARYSFDDAAAAEPDWVTAGAADCGMARDTVTTARSEQRTNNLFITLLLFPDHAVLNGSSSEYEGVARKSILFFEFTWIYGRRAGRVTSVSRRAASEL